MTTFFQVLIYGLAVGAVYGLISLGFVLIFKTTGAFNLAQGSLLMFFAFFCMSLTIQLGLPFYLSLFLTLVFAVILGFTIERLLLRPMRGKPVTAIIMMTLSLSIILKSIATLIWSFYSYRLPAWLPTGELAIGFLSLSWDYIALFIVIGITLIFFMIYFKYARFALSMRTVGEDRAIAQILGIKLNFAYGLAWAFCAVVAAIGGVVLGTLNSVNFTLSHFGLFVIPAIIIGGITSIPGALIGGFMVGIAEKLGAMYLGRDLPGFPEVIPYILALIVLYIKPGGIFGEKIIERI
jgi:branched-chain amino acid transport system permease protein